MSIALERNTFDAPVLELSPYWDALRRRQLRDFLMYCRARLRPGDVGLPESRRRRVPGLRRDEVAELVGVSCDWYRWLESGRDVRVSPRLVARLARALKLTAYEELKMYAFALPELYRAKTELRESSPDNGSFVHALLSEQ